MKKLIAAGPIQYQGRTYEDGDNLPAHDGAMVEAWLNAGTATWHDDTPTHDAAEPTAEAVLAAAAAMTVNTLRDMGVPLADESAFLGAENMAELIANTVNAITAAQDAETGQAGNDTGAPESTATEGQQTAGTGENGGNSAAPELVTGHLDAAQLERMTKPDLIKLAEDMDVDISAAKNNAERAALIAAVTVQAPKVETGGAQ